MKIWLANGTPCLKTPSRGGRHVELPTEVPGNGPVGRRQEAGHTPGTRSGCSGGAPQSQCTHKRYLYKYLPRIGGRPRSRGLRMTRQHRITKSRQGPQYDKLHHALGMRTGAPRALTANPLSHYVAGFSSSTAELEVPHWIEGWRPGGLLRRGRRAVRLGPAGAGRVRH